jgi:hypothetical protein
MCEQLEPLTTYVKMVLLVIRLLDLIVLTFAASVIQLDEQISSRNFLVMCLDYLTKHTLNVQCLAF